VLSTIFLTLSHLRITYVYSLVEEYDTGLTVDPKIYSIFWCISFVTTQILDRDEPAREIYSTLSSIWGVWSKLFL